MEYHNLQELREAVAMYLSRVNDVLKGITSADLDEAMMRLDNAIAKTDIEGIPAMLCRFDVHESRIISQTIDFINRFCDFLRFCNLNRAAIWKIDSSIGRKEDFIREVVDSLQEGKRALDEKGRTTPTPADKESAQLIAAYINGDFPSMTLEQFIDDMLLQRLLPYEKKRRVDYLLNECSGLITDDMRKMMLQACKETIEKPKQPAVIQEPEVKKNDAEPVDYRSLFDEDSLTRLCSYCHSGNIFPTSHDDFLSAVYHADFSEIRKTIIEQNLGSRTKLRYIISYLRKQAFGKAKTEQEKAKVSKWYKASAISIGINDIGKMAGANVTDDFKDDVDIAYNEPLRHAEIKANKKFRTF